MTTAQESTDRISPLTSFPFAAIHVLGIAGAFYTGWHPRLALAAFISYYVRMMGVTIGYHRFFSHRSFKTNRVFQFILAWWAECSVQKGALWWAAHHRHHHKYSDTPEDVHSPVQRGFWYSHVGWMLGDKYMETRTDRIRDFARYPELVFLDTHWYLPPVITGAVVWAVFGLPVFIWAGLTATVLLWHGTFCVNSLAHVFGRRRYFTSDTSRNSFLIAMITSGEGWHNNHHFYQSTANQGWHWWQIDPSFYVIRLFQLVGLVWDVRTPPKHVVATPGDTPLVDKLKSALPKVELPSVDVEPSAAID